MQPFFFTIILFYSYHKWIVQESQKPCSPDHVYRKCISRDRNWISRDRKWISRDRKWISQWGSGLIQLKHISHWSNQIKQPNQWRGQDFSYLRRGILSILSFLYFWYPVPADKNFITYSFRFLYDNTSLWKVWRLNLLYSFIRDFV